MIEEKCEFHGGPKDGAIEEWRTMPSLMFPFDVVLVCDVVEGKPKDYQMVRLYHEYLFYTRTEDDVYVYRYAGVKER